jgi:hypothetical protein
MCMLLGISALHSTVQPSSQVNTSLSSLFFPHQAIPFAYELRTLLDWTCTVTTLTW